jgi:EXPERA (EXPanded EBP superfamily)
MTFVVVEVAPTFRRGKKKGEGGAEKREREGRMPSPSSRIISANLRAAEARKRELLGMNSAPLSESESESESESDSDSGPAVSVVHSPKRASSKNKKASSKAASPGNSRVLPLLQRPFDLFLVVFFAANLVFVTYSIDFEQIVVKFTYKNGTIPDFHQEGVLARDMYTFDPPLWPRGAFLDLIHWYQFTFDPVIVARPPWWMATIVVDAAIFGPFYVFAIPRLVRGDRSVVAPTLMWAGLMLGMVLVILYEEFWGDFPTPHPQLVFLANFLWLVTPFLVLARFSQDLADPFGDHGRSKSRSKTSSTRRSGSKSRRQSPARRERRR